METRKKKFEAYFCAICEHFVHQKKNEIIIRRWFKHILKTIFQRLEPKEIQKEAIIFNTNDDIEVH